MPSTIFCVKKMESSSAEINYNSVNCTLVGTPGLVSGIIIIIVVVLVLYIRVVTFTSPLCGHDCMRGGLFLNAKLDSCEVTSTHTNFFNSLNLSAKNTPTPPMGKY